MFEIIDQSRFKVRYYFTLTASICEKHFDNVEDVKSFLEDTKYNKDPRAYRVTLLLNRETMESFTAEEEIYFIGNEARRVRQ